ncbi:MAG: hypothetical protein ACK52V_02855 [Betaproteobacteria bacterium]|jgi:hypothetical protein
MPLQKQTVDIPLGVGVDTITDPKQVQPGKLALVENGIFEKIGRMSARFGQTAIPNRTVATSTAGTPLNTTLMGGERVGALGSELVVDDGVWANGWSPSTNAWIQKGASHSSQVRSRFLSAGKSEFFTAFDVAQGGGYECHVFATGFGPGNNPAGQFATIIDQTSGEVVSEIELGAWQAIWTSCRVVFTNGRFFVYYNDRISGTRTDIDVRVFTVSTLSWSAPATAAGSASAVFGPFNVKILNNEIVLVTDLKAGLSSNVVNLYRCSNTTGVVVGGAVTVFTATSGTRVFHMINMCENITATADDAIYVCFTEADNGTGRANPRTYVAVYSTAYAVVTAAFQPVSGAQVRHGTMIAAAANSIRAAFYEQDTTGGITTGFLRVMQISRTGTTVDSAQYAPNACPVADIVTIGGRTLVPAVVESALQATYCLVDVTTGAALSNAADRVVTAFGNAEAVSSVYDVGKSLIVGSRLVLSLGSAVSLGGAASVTPVIFYAPRRHEVTLGLSAAGVRTQIGDATFRSGGTLWAFDGMRNVETNFRLAPEIVVSGFGGAVSSRTFGVAVVFEYRDAKGQIHRSAPTFANITTTSASLEVIVRNTAISNKLEYSAVVYRTVANGSTFYRAGVGVCNATTSRVTVNPDMSDATLTDNEILYTTGGVLESAPPPAANYVFPHQNRLVLCACEDGNEAFISREYVTGEVPYFNEAIKVRIDDGAGPIVAGASFDDKFVLFKRNSIYAFAGSGPNDVGSQNDLSLPQIVSPDVGCADPLSVIRVPQGVFFKSERGYFMLNRGLQLDYLGAEVDSFKALPVTGAVHIPEQNQIRFYTGAGPTLVYDYYFQQWTTFTATFGVSASVWNGQAISLRSDGTAIYEDRATFLDQGQNVPLKLVTPWLRSDSLQGFQRIYEAAFLGSNLSGHTFQVRVGYDYEDTYSETLTLASSVFTTSVEQVKVRPARQKCQSIRFEVTKLNPSNTAGPGINLSGMAITVGVKGNINRTRVQQVAT